MRLVRGISFNCATRQKTLGWQIQANPIFLCLLPERATSWQDWQATWTQLGGARHLCETNVTK